ncbi:nicotinate phosphoribosyltransferase [bacterium]|nr:nicotinate phosphoribosyltransferase [bacterium]
MRRKLGILETDLYQLTMLQGYFKNGRANQQVVFEAFFRRLPFNGGFAIFAGLEQIIDYLKDLHFSKRDIGYLRRTGLFAEDFLQYLLNEWHFNCDVSAVAEGTIVFPNEPLVRVSGPIISAQLVETAILNAINYQTLVATRAARLVIAADGDPVIDFGLRRAPTFAGVAASRAAYIGGVSGTSNVEAGRQLNIPVSGTHAHSWVQSFPNELEAFKAYAKTYPKKCLLLVDSYETLKSGLPNAIKVAKEFLPDSQLFVGIRIDSGDLAYLSKEARKMLDQAGLTKAKIVASNDLDEFIIADLKRQGAKIDIWGVGTKLVYPPKSLGGVYKLVAAELNGKIIPVVKISSNPEKTTIPGEKEIYRVYDKNGMMLADVLALVEEKIFDQKEIEIKHPDIEYKFDKLQVGRIEKLLIPIYTYKDGLIYKSPKLKEIRKKVQEELKQLPEEYKRFINPHIYRVGLTKKLFGLRKKLIQEKLDRR